MGNVTERTDCSYLHHDLLVDKQHKLDRNHEPDYNDAKPCQMFVINVSVEKFKHLMSELQGLNWFYTNIVRGRK